MLHDVTTLQKLLVMYILDVSSISVHTRFYTNASILANFFPEVRDLEGRTQSSSSNAIFHRLNMVDYGLFPKSGADQNDRANVTRQWLLSFPEQ